MPQMGESVMEGTVIEWTKKVGDSVEVDETILEIATDKVDSEVPSPEAGILAEILVEEGDTVEVGKPIAIIETDADAEVDSSEKESGSEEEAEPTSNEESETIEPEEESVEAAPAPAGGESGERVEVVMPQMGESVVEATIIEWSKSVGDKVEEDEMLLEISTDKVDSEVPAPVSGTLVEILAEADETIEVGQTIAVIATGDAPAAPAPAKDEDTSKAGMTKEDVAQMKPEDLAKKSDSDSASDIQRETSDGRMKDQ